MILFGNQVDVHVTAPFTEHADGSMLLGLSVMEGEYACGCPLIAIQFGLAVITITLTIGNNHPTDEYPI